MFTQKFTDFISFGIILFQLMCETQEFTIIYFPVRSYLADRDSELIDIFPDIIDFPTKGIYSLKLLLLHFIIYYGHIPDLPFNNLGHSYAQVCSLFFQFFFFWLTQSQMYTLASFIR